MGEAGMTEFGRSGWAYTHWIKRFILFNQKRHPSEMCAPEVERLLVSMDDTHGLMAGLMGRRRHGF